MFEAIMNLLLLAAGIAVMAFWIAALAESDGRCHMEDCGGCPLEGDCPEQKVREKEHEDC